LVFFDSIGQFTYFPPYSLGDGHGRSQLSGRDVA